MFANIDLGPQCPVCESAMWEFTTATDFMGVDNEHLAADVTAEAECFDCDSVFAVSVTVDDEDCLWTSDGESVSPPQGFGWGTVRSQIVATHVLHVWGDTNDSFGDQYCQTYDFQDIRIIEDQS